MLDRKPTGAALRMRVRELTDLVESSMIGLHWAAADGTILWANGAELAMLGYTRAEYVGHRASEFHTDPDTAAEMQRRLEQGEELVNYRARLLARDGTIRHVLIDANVRWDEDGQFVYARCFTRDISQRISKEALLRESEELFARAFRSNPQPMSLATMREGRYIDVNDSFLEVSGYERAEIIGRTSAELDLWETPGVSEEVAGQVTERGAARNVKVRLKTKGGEYRVLLASAEAVEIGSERCLLVASTDITDRERAREALARSERYFRALIENAADIIFTCDAEGVLRYLSPSVTRVLGHEAEELTGADIFGLIHPDDAPAFRATYRDVASRPDVWATGQCRHRHKDGSWRLVEYTCRNFLDDPAVRGVVINSRDITERSRAEEERQRANRRIVEIFESITEAYIALDREWRFTYLNPEAERILCQKQESCLGKTAREVLPWIAGTKIYKAIARARVRNELVEVEEYYRPLKGWFVIRAYPSDEGVVIYFRDITERKNDHLALRRLTAQLTRAQEEERRRIARELHDGAAQSVAAVKVRLERLAFRDEEGAADAAAVREELDRLSATLAGVQHDLRHLAHTLHPSVLEHFGLVNALRSYIRGLRADAEIELTSDPPEGFPRLPRDAESVIYRIAVEAITNALRHGKAAHISVSLKAREDAVLVAVADDGVGFEVADERTQAGLGLICMRERGGMIGAKLSINSRPGEGTTVELCAPTTGVEADEVPSHLKPAPGDV